MANWTYSFDSDRTEAWNAGLTMDHNPTLSSFAQVRYLNRVDAMDTDSLLLRYGVEYLLSAKYHLAVAQTIDLERDDSRDISFVVTRRLPRMLLRVAFSYDTIENTTSVGLALTPEGLGGSGDPARNPFIFTR